MSGHSKWSTIKRAKGTADAKKGMAFTKLANMITISAKLGGSGDPGSNPRLRLAIDTARSVNMPQINVKRAIDKGLGILPGQSIEEVAYEGFGPGKVAFIIEGMTDNKLRTTAEIKNLFERSGGALGTHGSVAYMFEKKGLIKVKSKGMSKEDDELEIIDLGAEDVEEFEENGTWYYMISSEPASLHNMSTKLTQSGFKVESADIVFEPTILKEITDKSLAEKVIEFSEKLEEHDDIHKVYSNMDISEELASSG